MARGWASGVGLSFLALAMGLGRAQVPPPVVAVAAPALSLAAAAAERGSTPPPLGDSAPVGAPVPEAFQAAAHERQLDALQVAAEASRPIGLPEAVPSIASGTGGPVFRGGFAPLPSAAALPNTSVPTAAPAQAPHVESSGSGSLLSVVKTGCLLSNLVFQISPFPEAWSWSRRGSTGKVEPAPLVAVFFGGFQWCVYGTAAWYVTGRAGFLLLVKSNLGGVVFGAYYLYSFRLHCKEEYGVRRLSSYLTIAGGLVLVQLVALVTVSQRDALFFSGIVGSCCAILVSASILVPVPEVLRTKNPESINTTVCCASLGASVLWLICGIMLDDPNIAVPQCVGLCAATLCLYLKLVAHPDDAGASDDFGKLLEGAAMDLGEPPVKPRKLGLEGCLGPSLIAAGRGWADKVGSYGAAAVATPPASRSDSGLNLPAWPAMLDACAGSGGTGGS